MKQTRNQRDAALSLMARPVLVSLRMDRIDCRRFESPDDKLDFGAHGRIDIVHMPDGASGMRAVLEPGWVWSKHEKPLLGNPLACPMKHTGYCIRGELVVRMVESGEERTIKSGDLFEIPPGHEARVQGDMTCELIMFAPVGPT